MRRMWVIDQFGDLNDPDGFVWVRGFPDMCSRAAALESFYYGGLVWQTLRRAANATMSDADSVLSASRAPHARLPPRRQHAPLTRRTDIAGELVVATINDLAPATAAEFPDFFDGDLAPVPADTGASIAASLVTERSPNIYPRRLIREDANVFVWFARFPDLAAYGRHLARPAQSATPR